MNASKTRAVIHFVSIAVLFQLALSATEANEPHEDPRLKPTLNTWESIYSTARQKGMVRPGELGPQADNLLPTLRELLPHADIVSKLKLAEAIWRISGKTEETANVLVAIILDDEWARPFTAEQFNRMGSAAFSSYPVIAEMTKDPHDTVRECATKILGSFGPQHKLAMQDHLLSALNDKSPQVRIAASEAILSIDGAFDKAVATLIEIVSQPMEIVPAARKATPAESLLVSTIQAIGRFEGAAVDAVLPLCIHLNSKNINVRQATANALARIGPGAELAIHHLDKAMQDTESIAVPLVHCVISLGDDAAKALGTIGPTAVPVLLKALNHPKAVVRHRAARELGRIPEAARQTAAPLLEKLSDPNPEVRLEVIKSIGNLGKAGDLAAPALTKLLFNSLGPNSFPSDKDLVVSLSTSPAALRSLRGIQATEDQVVPTLVESLHGRGTATLDAIATMRETPDRIAKSFPPLRRLISKIDAFYATNTLTLEAIATIRAYPNRMADFTPPLHRLLQMNDAGAACALAALGARAPEIQAVLANNLFSNGHVNPIAAMGIGQWVAHGGKLEEALQARLIADTKRGTCPLSFWTIMLRLTPDDKETVVSLLNTARRTRGRFDSCPSDFVEAEAALLELIDHQSVEDALVLELEDRSKLVENEFLAARVLIASMRRTEQAFTCLANEVAANEVRPEFGGLADFLGTLPQTIHSQSLLLRILQSHVNYFVYADLNANTIEHRVVGERAALALVRHQEFSALLEQLASTDALVRVRVVRALGACGVDAMVPGLLALVKDADPKERLEVVKTIGRISLEHPETRDEFRRILTAVIKDRRRSVSDEALRTLKRW